MAAGGNAERAGGRATAGASPGPDDPEDSRGRLLLAVRAEVLAHGMDRLSVTAVARRAGLARVTLYRRGGDLKRLVLAAVADEIRELIRSATTGLPTTCGRDRVVEFAVRIVHGVAASPFLVRVAGHPDLLEPHLTGPAVANRELILAAAIDELRRGMADGSVRPGPPELYGSILMQALQAFALRGGAPTPGGIFATDDELRRLVDGYLRPTAPVDLGPAAGQTSPRSPRP